MSACPDGEVKLTNKPTCETEVTCTDVQVFNPADNTCTDLECAESEVINRTVKPLACIEKSKCRQDSDKLVSTNGESCITTMACTSVANHVATASGDCEACQGDTTVINVDRNDCITAQACHGGDSSGENSLLGNECITDANCIKMAGHVATDDGVCQQCTGTNNVRNVGKTACITAEVCQGTSHSPTSLLGTECITDSDCNAMENHVARLDGLCEACAAPQIPFVATGTCDLDADSDGVADANDSCPMGEANIATTEDASADTADPDGDGCKNSEDVDDDNDGLIEIATAEQLDNIRHDLAGHSYNDGSTFSTAGAPEEATENCAEERSAGSGIYLCGYELTADIDLQ